MNAIFGLYEVMFATLANVAAIEFRKIVCSDKGEEEEKEEEDEKKQLIFFPSRMIISLISV